MKETKAEIFETVIKFFYLFFVSIISNARNHFERYQRFFRNETKLYQ